MKVLVIGPSSKKSKGGMATVIKEIEQDKELCDSYHLETYNSFIDGNKLIRLLFCVKAYLWFCLTKRDYDIYHIHAASRGSTFRKGYYARKIKKWGKKVIIHIHGAQYMEFYNESSEKKKKQIIDTLKSADRVIALSQDWKNKFDNVFGLNNCFVVENGINADILKPAITNPKSNQYRFVCLGRFGQRKGTYDLLEAVELVAKKIPDIKVYLAGDGEVDKVRDLVNKKGLTNQIEVLGWIDFDEKVDILKKVSTVILPSYNEGLPMAILEGMACGKAIISTSVGAIPEVIGSQNGILVNAGDVNALANAMEKMCNDAVLLNSMSKANIQLIKDKFDIVCMHDKIRDIYDNLYDEK